MLYNSLINIHTTYENNVENTYSNLISVEAKNNSTNLTLEGWGNLFYASAGEPQQGNNFYFIDTSGYYTNSNLPKLEPITTQLIELGCLILLVGF